MHEHQSPPSSESDHDIPYLAELQRKAIHLVALVIPAGMALLGNEWALIVLVPLALLMLGADALRWRSERFHVWVDRTFGFMMRGNERGRGQMIVLTGATWVILTAALLALVFPNRIAIFALVVFLVCDAAAAMVGRRFGRIRWPGSFRTVEGTAAFVTTGLVIALIFPDIAFWVGLLSILAGAAAELPAWPPNDNLRVPVAIAFTQFLLERFVVA